MKSAGCKPARRLGCSQPVYSFSGRLHDTMEFRNFIFELRLTQGGSEGGTGRASALPLRVACGPVRDYSALAGEKSPRLLIDVYSSR
jgi:hypothetical protein